MLGLFWRLSFRATSSIFITTTNTTLYSKFGSSRARIFANLKNIIIIMPPKRKVAAKSTKTAATTTTTTKRPKVKESIIEEENDEEVQEQQEEERRPSSLSSSNKPADEESEIRKSSNGKAFNLKIVSWNVNGIRAALKNGSALSYFRDEACDILCLQETKCADRTIPNELKSLDLFPFKYYAASAQDGYAGVAVLCKRKPISVKIGLGLAEHDEEGRLITATFEDFIVVNAYVPNAGRGLKRLDYRMQWDEAFRVYLKRLNETTKPVIVCGDLNVAHREIDLANPKTNVKNAGFTPEERANFTELLRFAGLSDTFRALYPTKIGCYTFWSYMRAARSKNIGWRLDYFLVSERFGASICDNQIRSDVMGSDHCPIVLYAAI